MALRASCAKELGTKIVNVDNQTEWKSVTLLILVERAGRMRRYIKRECVLLKSLRLKDRTSHPLLVTLLLSKYNIFIGFRVFKCFVKSGIV